MSNAGNKLDGDFYVEDTNMMVTPSPKHKNKISKTIYYMFIDHYELIL